MAMIGGGEHHGALGDGAATGRLAGGASGGQLQQGATDHSTVSGGSMSPVGKSGAVMANEGPKVIFKSREMPQTIELDEEGPSVEALRSQEMLNRTVQFVMQKPDNATQILRSWVTDGAN